MNMKAPSYQELLSVQSHADYDLVREAYPEWYALPLEERVTSDGITYEQRVSLAKIQPIEVISIILMVGFIIGILIYALVNY